MGSAMTSDRSRTTVPFELQAIDAEAVGLPLAWLRARCC